MTVERLITIGCGALLAFLACLFAYKAAANPMAAQRAALAADLAEVEGGWEPPARTAGRSPEELQQIVLAQATLWRSLVDAPPPPPKPFDMDGAMKGITPTRRSMGTGESLAVRIETPAAPRGEYYGVGDAIAGAAGIVVKEIGRDYVVFSKTHEGKEYTKRLAR